MSQLQRPPCFTPRQWAYYLEAVETCQKGGRENSNPACADCTDKYQRRMIREYKCANPCKILPGNPLHRWGKNDLVPEGVE